MIKKRSADTGLAETVRLSCSVAFITVIALNFLEYIKIIFQTAEFTPLPSVPETRSYDALIIPSDNKISGYSLKSKFSKRLIFYHRPPKTASTSVRIAMSRALRESGLVSAKCFNRIEWNQMALRTIINRRSVDFYGCHTILTHDRYTDIVSMRAGNVTFMTSTRSPGRIILSSYMQHHRQRDIASISDTKEIADEVSRYKQYVDSYPVAALYNFHGADHPLVSCPVSFEHEEAMRRIAERYEIVVDMNRPEESGEVVEIITGLKPNFSLSFNQRTTVATPMIEALASVTVSHKTCGNELVHKVLTQQFNLIKDRLMQNRCFDEEFGTYKLCDKTSLSSEHIHEHTRKESFIERIRLEKM